MELVEKSFKSAKITTDYWETKGKEHGIVETHMRPKITKIAVFLITQKTTATFCHHVTQAWWHFIILRHVSFQNVFTIDSK